MSWTLLGGGDHGGQDWTIDSDVTIDGEHYNIKNFKIEAGKTASLYDMGRLDTEHLLTIRAQTISIEGTLNGAYKGYIGGNETLGFTDGEGPGGGDGSSTNGGGAAYGGLGGAGTDASSTAAYGSASTAAIRAGSGGGRGGAADGGDGGGRCALIARTITVSGTINFNGSVSQGDAGGGSGGGVLMLGSVVTISGTISADGGASSTPTIGGGGGGGRIKIFSATLDTTGATITYAGGAGYQNGGAGSYSTYTVGAVNPTHSLGQTFTSGDVLKSYLEAVKIYVETVNTSGNITCSLYDDDVKTTLLASKSDTISATGEHTFTFGTPYLLDAGTQYYLEITSDTTADILAGIYTPSDAVGGSMYIGSNEIDGFDIYFKLYGFGHLRDMQIYNAADSTRMLEPVNNMLVGAIHTINANGTGSISYTDDFTTEKYKVDVFAQTGVTHDTINDELDITALGYVDYLIDAKYPITGIPIFTGYIDFTVGTPLVQISLDDNNSPTDWFDIDDAIIDGVETEYELRSNGNVDFKGQTKIWLRIGACTLKNIIVDADIVTVDAVIPEVKIGSSNTFNVTQPYDSSPASTIDMDYRYKRWL